MGGLTTAGFSSNWKKLQETLKSESQANPGVKRKREEPTKSKWSASNGFKKTKLSTSNTVQLGARRKMGGYLSTNTQAEPSRRSRLVNDHDIAPEDISAAYGTTATSNRKHIDDENGGLHPTRKAGKYVSLDCEMVGTGPPPHMDNVLARVSLVNFHGEQIYDSYVQAPPGTRIEDYRTHVSGIKPHHMKSGYARTFAEVQKDVANLLDGRILVGHALKNDLSALILSHPRRDMRDTSRYAKFRVESKGKPPALRNLAKSELGLEIQSGAHSSVEDARATMLLFHKEKKGFEEDNRRQFGTKKVVAVRDKKGKEMSPDMEDGSDVDEDEDEDEEDSILLDGEDEDIAIGTTSRGGAGPGKAKKRKTKKRTKRK